MAFTINGILCQEIVAGYTESADLGDGVSSRKGFLCNWADRFTVAQGLLGLTSASGKGSAITLYYPARHPELLNCYVRRIDFEGVGLPSQGPYQLAWDKCIVWAEFGTGRFNPSGALSFGSGSQGFVYAEQKMASSCEWVTIPRRYTKFKTSGKKTGADAGVRLALVEIEITLHALPYMPDQVVLAKSGQINNAAYLGVGTGKLIFNGVTTSESANTDGTYTAEGTYSFTARTQRWDYGFDGDSNRWDQIVWPDGSTPFISSSDFTTIIPTGYSF